MSYQLPNNSRFVKNTPLSVVFSTFFSVFGIAVKHDLLCLIYYMNAFILYRHECFTGEYTTRKIHTKLHPGLEWRIFHILTSEDINDFTNIKFVSWIVPRKSLAIFGNFREMFGNVRLAFGTILENLQKSSENRQKRCDQYVYIIKRTLHVSSKI